VQKFYFRHTTNLPSLLSVTRDDLWPRNDRLLPIVAAGITAIYPIRRFLPHVVPHRLDLLDGGFEQGKFFEYCKEYARMNVLDLWSEEDVRDLDHGLLRL